MSAPKKNLLEAFKTAAAETPPKGPSGARPEPSPVPTPQAGTSEPRPAVAPPVHPELKPVEAATPQQPIDTPLGSAAAAPEPSFAEEAAAALAKESGRDLASLVPALAIALIAFVAGLLVGRLTVDPEALAAEPGAETAGETPPAAAGLVPSRPTPVESSAPRPGEEVSPLLDPENRFTIVVQTTSLDNADAAWATYHHLRDEGVSVFRPVESDRRYYLVLAGAAPRCADLTDLEASIRGLSRNGRTRVYADAYCAKIDSLVGR